MQFHNQNNPAAYQATLGPEIFQELSGKIDSFVAGAGSGDLRGCRILKSKKSSTRLAVVEPEGSILNGGPAHGHELKGSVLSSFHNF